mmetsp:Transcript_19738/g.30443  ORF Transcript_19738/g.30443 Transcript_19738/m.30443 type:complete len:768 (-) Transcript_19738:107-2410(-)
MSSINHRTSKRRRRRPPQAYHATYESSVEERLLQQAIANSKLDQRRPFDGKLDIPMGPTFFPTVEEFEGNPLHYIEKIKPQAEKYGICKIVPPKGWNPPFCVDMSSDQKFQTKEQLLWRLQEGISFGDGEEYNARDYQQMASEKAQSWKAKYYPEHDIILNRRRRNGASTKTKSSTEPATPEEKEEERKILTPQNLERDYWDMVETHNQEVTVEYGNDVETDKFGSGFPLSERGRSKYGTLNVEKMGQPEPKFGTPDFYKETWWNLNNIPSAPESVLRHVRVGINGINVPWMYYGCMFSTFCWHNEDNYLYSINYHHKGAAKQWYGVPGVTKKDSDGLEKVFKSFLSIKMRDVPDLLHHITTMFSPRLLQNSNVEVCKLLQYPGEFVVTFPRAFHGGFSLGPNAGEAVNFATHDWIAYGSDANERYRSYARPAVFSHDRLTFTMANHLHEQKRYGTCSLLLEELERVVNEELSLREKLIETGVRDVSDMITLPRNRLDQLDEESADYDDKRLCHACKHICFFSAVACECSQTKVSCLRHSHYMCRCTPQRRYLMIWSDEKELKSTLQNVRQYCQVLKKNEQEKESKEDRTSAATATATTTTSTDKEEQIKEPKVPPHKKSTNSMFHELPPIAPGAEQDWELHKNEPINLEPVLADPNYIQPVRTTHQPHKVSRSATSMAGPRTTNTATNTSTSVMTVSDASSIDDEKRRQVVSDGNETSDGEDSSIHTKTTTDQEDTTTSNNNGDTVILPTGSVYDANTRIISADIR